jgi:hypothetical protein
MSYSTSTPENPFWIVPIGEQRMIEPDSKYTVENDYNYVFGMPYGPKNPLLYFAIYLPPQHTWRDG